MRVEYIRTVKTPPCKVGDKGEIKELAKHLANELIAEGYVKQTSQKDKKEKPNENAK